MFDLHSHILPGIDDGAPELAVSLQMARAYVDQGVEIVACTPHILPGLYHNSGTQIRQAVADLQRQLDEAGIPLRLTTGADNHVVPDFVGGLSHGHLLTIGDSRYVLVEPPHHVAPPQLEELFFNVLVAGYVPVLTHPERLTWIEQNYAIMKRLAARGVWMQITSGSLSGSFGRRPKYWARRMLSEGLVHILATDAHNMTRRPPDLLAGYRAAEDILGQEEAEKLVVTRPYAILSNDMPANVPPPLVAAQKSGAQQGGAADYDPRGNNEGIAGPGVGSAGGFGRRLRRLFGQ